MLTQEEGGRFELELFALLGVILTDWTTSLRHCLIAIEIEKKSSLKKNMCFDFKNVTHIFFFLIITCADRL